MEYTIIEDINAVLKLLNLSISDLAESLDVSRSTIHRILNKKTKPSALFLESFYSFAYSNQIRKIDLNNLKIQFAKDMSGSILFHGAKNQIDGPVDLDHSRINLDFGPGFYLGESYEQASSYVCSNEKSSVYIFDTNGLKGLKVKTFDVNEEWMLLICYFRGQLEKYENKEKIVKLKESISGCDVIVAPIANNNMYDIMNRFVKGFITNEQAISALSASSLGKQVVLISKKACKRIKMVNRLYLSKIEKKDIIKINHDRALTMMDKATLSIQKYRRKGKYIEELLND